MSRRSHDKIIRAALSVFSRKGFHQTKMDEIAREAGVAKGTLYYNFPGKSRLFAVAVTRGLAGFMDTIRREMDSDLPFSIHFYRLIETMIDLHLSHANLTRILLNELSTGINQKALAEIETERNRYLGFVTRILDQGKAAGYLSFEDAKQTAVGLLGFMGNLCDYCLKQPGAVNRKEVVDTTVSLLASGIVREH